jgi:hypothetical protein
VEKLSRKDLKHIKKIVNLAIVDEKAREALSAGRLPNGKWKLTPEALSALHSITSEELAAFASVYTKMRSAGASRSRLEDAIIL